MIRIIVLFLFILNMSRLNAQEINLGASVYTYLSLSNITDNLRITNNTNIIGLNIDFQSKKLQHRIEIFKTKVLSYSVHPFNDKFSVNHSNYNHSNYRYILSKNVYSKNNFNLNLGGFTSFGYRDKQISLWVYKVDHIDDYSKIDFPTLISEYPVLYEIDLGFRVNFNFVFLDRFSLDLIFDTSVNKRTTKGTVNNINIIYNEDKSIEQKEITFKDYKDVSWNKGLFKSSLGVSYKLYSKNRINNKKYN